jgi:aspartate racemase
MKTIGVLGGMGPEATNQLCRLITAVTPAQTDQQHVPVICFNNPRIPSRAEAILHQGPSPVDEMVKTAVKLQECGADLIVMPCNCAHHFREQVQAGVEIPILDMIAATAEHIARNYDGQAVGLLASSATIVTGLYEEPLRRVGKRLLVPEPVDQEKVMNGIYGPSGVKAGRKTIPKNLFLDAASSLLQRGADIIIAGCTEISVVLNRRNVPFALIDPLEVIARAAVELSLPPHAVESIDGEAATLQPINLRTA